jgi:hypothetical protein
MPRQKILNKLGERAFYPKHLRRVVLWLLVSVVLNAIFLASIAWLALHQPLPAYYASNSAGKIANMMRLDDPNMTATALLDPSPPAEPNTKSLEGKPFEPSQP